MRRSAAILAVTALAALPAAALAASFGAPEDLPTNGAPEGPDLRIGVAADGTVVAAWPDHESNSTQVKASIRPPGGAFGPVQKLSPDGVNASFLYLGVSPQGHAVAFWREAGSPVRFSVRAPGGAFGPPADTPVPDGLHGAARFDVGAGGSAALVYPVRGTTSDEVVASLLDPATGSWGPLEQVMSVPISGLPPAACGVKVAPSGDVLALYGNGSYLRTKYRPAGGAWGNEQSFPDDGQCQHRTEPDRGLDVDASGRFALLWYAGDSTSDTLGAIRGPGQAGAWASTVIVPGDQPNAQSSSLAADDAGNVVIGIDLGGGEIALPRYSASSQTWNTSARFGPTPGFPLGSQRVAADRDSGEFIVTMAGTETANPGPDGEAENEPFAAGAAGPAAAFGPLTRLTPHDDPYGAGSITVASGGTWAIGFEQFDGANPFDLNRLQVVGPGGGAVTVPPPGPGDPPPAGGPPPGPGGSGGSVTPAPGKPRKLKGVCVNARGRCRMTARFVAPGPGTAVVALRRTAKKQRFKTRRRTIVVKRAGTVKVRLGKVPRGKYKLTAVLKANGKRSRVASATVKVRR